MKRRMQGLSLVVAAGLVSCPALAQPARPPSSSAAAASRAESLFQEGMRAVAQKQWADAERKFLAAFALNPSYDVAANLGQTQFRLGKHREAAQHLAHAVKNWPLVGKKEPRVLAEKRLAQLRGLLGSLTIAVDVPGATVLVDGTEMGRSPLLMEVFVDPGSHVVEAKLEGYQDAKAVVEVGKGAKGSPSLKMVRVQEEQGPPPTATTAPPKRSIVPGIVVGGVALASFAVGIGLRVAGSAKHSRAVELSTALGAERRSCVKGASNFDVRCAELGEAASSSDRLRNAATGVLIGGGAAALASALYLVWPAQRVAVTPVTSGSGAGLWVTGEF